VTIPHRLQLAIVVRAQCTAPSVISAHGLCAVHHVGQEHNHEIGQLFLTPTTAVTYARICTRRALAAVVIVRNTAKQRIIQRGLHALRVAAAKAPRHAIDRLSALMLMGATSVQICAKLQHVTSTRVLFPLLKATGARGASAQKPAILVPSSESVIAPVPNSEGRNAWTNLTLESATLTRAQKIVSSATTPLGARVLAAVALDSKLAAAPS
jgi:hypothetical protein